MDAEKVIYLEERAKEVRSLLVKTIGHLGEGHLGGSLSIVEVLTLLYFSEMNVDPKNPNLDGRDRLVLSKGHAGPALYSVLALKGFFPIEQLKTLNAPNTDLPSHCDMLKTPGIDMTTGSLGQGISCAVGIAKAAKLMGGKEYIYAIVGDGESQEGSVWEASMAATHFKLDNLIVFLDYNKLQIDGPVSEVMDLGNPFEKWSAFGFNTFEVNGHDMVAIHNAIKKAKKANSGKPTMIILNTIKGYGVSFIEAKGSDCHKVTLDKDKVAQALLEINGEAS